MEKTNKFEKILVAVDGSEQSMRSVEVGIAEIQKKGKENEVAIESKIRETTESIPAEIIRYAKEVKTDLIVVGSRGRSELEKLFLGSIASGVLGHASCPVLVVR